MAFGTVSTDVIQTSDGLTLGAGNATLMKNKLINGAMLISQRGSSFTPANGDYTLDRWQFQISQASKLTVATSTDAPTGFSNSMLVTSSSAYSVGAGDYFSVLQSIEGFNTYDLSFGTANAKTVTLSFWVKSTLTGTFGGTLINAAYSRSYPFTYTISSASTWTQISVTIAGDTTGTWVGATNGIGMQVNFGLGVGSNNSGTAGSWGAAGKYSATGAVSVVGTNAATWQVTGIQLERGSSATGFEYVNYQTSLANCQRYYAKMTALNTGSYNVFGSGYGQSSTAGTMFVKYPVTMRAAATVSQSNLAVANPSVLQNVTAISNADCGSDTSQVACTVASGLTTGAAYLLYASGSSNAYIAFSAEL